MGERFWSLFSVLWSVCLRGGLSASLVTCFDMDASKPQHAQLARAVSTHRHNWHTNVQTTALLHFLEVPCSYYLLSSTSITKHEFGDSESRETDHGCSKCCVLLGGCLQSFSFQCPTAGSEGERWKSSSYKFSRVQADRPEILDAQLLVLYIFLAIQVRAAGFELLCFYMQFFLVVRFYGVSAVRSIQV